MLLAAGIPAGSVVQSYNTQNKCENVKKETKNEEIVQIHPVTREEHKIPTIDFSQVEREEDEIGDIAGYAMGGDLSGATIAPATYYDDGISMVIRDVDGRIVETYEAEYFDAAQLADEAVECADALQTEHVDFKDDISAIKAAVLNKGKHYVETQYGESIASLCDGVVASSQYETGYGYCVTITVSSGDIIAYAGNSGITIGGVTIINVN